MIIDRLHVEKFHASLYDQSVYKNPSIHDHGHIVDFFLDRDHH